MNRIQICFGEFDIHFRGLEFGCLNTKVFAACLFMVSKASVPVLGSSLGLIQFGVPFKPFLHKRVSEYVLLCIGVVCASSGMGYHCSRFRTSMFLNVFAVYLSSLCFIQFGVPLKSFSHKHVSEYISLCIAHSHITWVLKGLRLAPFHIIT